MKRDSEAMQEQIYLNGDWQFRLGDNVSSSAPKQFKKHKRWINAIVPGTIHTDLFNNKLIDDPFYSNNELKLGWISESDWVYKTTFDLPSTPNNQLPIMLVFDGIDTVATVYLNDIKVGFTMNMFLKYEFDVAKYLKPQKNELKIIFQSPITFSQSEELKYGKLQVALNSNRVYIRKAQYSFGWDWGPSFPTMGIWRNVYLLKEDKSRIDDFRFNTIEITNNTALIEIKFDLKKYIDEKLQARITLKGSEFNCEKVIDDLRDENTVKIEVKNPKLWWPNGYGEQQLYEIEIELFDNSHNLIDLLKKKIGIRKIELQLEENGKQTFGFIVNGKKIFAKGVNWIPGDAFLPRVTNDKYTTLLKYAKNGNMNIVRVWGGGVYENDLFYELCDELGLLIWHDFMFACGSYPEHKEFLNNLEEEIQYNVNRLQYHPSIAIWCGNNENEWIWMREQKTNYKLMPGYKIYHEKIPTMLKNLDPMRPYWPSSPFGFDEDPNSQTSGNRHQWDIWSKWIDYTKVVSDDSLFITEFGFQGPANKSTFEKYLPKQERKIQSEVFEFHNKQIEGPERVTRFLSAHLPLTTRWDEYIFLTQLNQGFALKMCLEHWRFNQPTTNGNIIWQLNDTWPATSWALIDSELKPKMAYYFVKNSFAPIAAGFKNHENFFEILGLNQTSKDFVGRLEMLTLNSASGEIFKKQKILVRLNHESISVLAKLEKTDFLDDSNLVIVSLYDEKKNLVHRNVQIFKPWKYLTLPKAKIKVNLKEKRGEQFAVVTANKPAFFVDLISTDGEFSDRGFIVLPKEKIKVGFRSTRRKPAKKKINVYSLNNFLGN